MGLNVWVLVFYRANVAAAFSPIGNAEVASEEAALNWARWLEAKMHPGARSFVMCSEAAQCYLVQFVRIRGKEL